MADAILCGGGIYAIRNTVTGKCYVGSTTDFRRRKRTHFLKLKNGTHDNRLLRSAARKYGLGAFVFEILEEVSDFSGLLQRETHWIQQLSTAVRGKGYNLRVDPTNNGGLSHDAETRERISASLSKYLQQPEVKAKMSAIRTGTKRSEETKAKQSVGRAGKLHTEECKARMSEIARNRPPPTAETKAMIAESMTGLHAGGRNPMAKMTADTVALLRKRFAAGAAVPVLAAEFSMSVRQTRDIVNYRAWANS